MPHNGARGLCAREAFAQCSAGHGSAHKTQVQGVAHARAALTGDDAAKLSLSMSCTNVETLVPSYFMSS